MLVPASLSAHYVDRARSLGDPAEYVPLPDIGHMEMITGHGSTFQEWTTRVDSVLHPPPP